MYLISHKKKFIMCRVMKTGSTSFRESFARMPGVDLVADKAFGRHFSMAEIREAVGEETYSTYFKCALVRNPWARLVSYYVWSRKGGTPIIELEPYDKFIESIMPGFKDMVKGLDKIPYSMTSRIKGLFNIETSLSEEALKKANIDTAISMPQYDFVKGADFIGKLEDIKGAYNHICQTVSLPHVPLKQYNRSFIPSWKAFYDDKTRKIVEKHYAKDIKAFGYQF